MRAFLFRLKGLALEVASHRHLGSPWRVSKRSNARSASKRPRSFATTCRNLTAFRRRDLRRPLAPLAAGRRQEAASRRRRRTLTRGQNSGHRRCGPFSAGGVPWSPEVCLGSVPPTSRNDLRWSADGAAQARNNPHLALWARRTSRPGTLVALRLPPTGQCAKNGERAGRRALCGAVAVGRY